MEAGFKNKDNTCSHKPRFSYMSTWSVFLLCLGYLQWSFVLDHLSSFSDIKLWSSGSIYEWCVDCEAVCICTPQRIASRHKSTFCYIVLWQEHFKWWNRHNKYIEGVEVIMLLLILHIILIHIFFKMYCTVQIHYFPNTCFS